MEILPRKTVELAIMALIVVNVFELVYFFKIRNESRLYDPHVRFPAPSGYLSDNRFMTAAANCYVVRLSSDGCPYCRLDQNHYIYLAQQARRSGCKTIILPPKVGQIKSNGDNSETTKLQFVDMAFGRVLNPFITPQTFLLDGAGGILWDWEGAMDQRALANALHALERVH